MNIKRLIREEVDDFDWIRGIEPDTDLEVGQLWYKYDGFDEYNRPYVAKLLESQFNDIKVDGNRIHLHTDGYCDFTGLYSSHDNAQYGYVNESLAEAIFCEEDYWEPYYDVVYDWVDQVWELVKDNPKLTQHILDHIKETYMGEEVEDKMNEDGYDEIPLDGKYLKWLSENIHDLGDLIDDDNTFEDLKNELRWAYESAYNTASRDQIYRGAMEPIEEHFGDGKWESKIVRKMDGDVTRHELVFDITGTFWNIVEEFLSECWENCGGYHSRTDTEMEIEEWCEECHVIDQNYFLSLFIDYNNDYGESWNPRFDEYPSTEKLKEYFEEDVYGRF